MQTRPRLRPPPLLSHSPPERQEPLTRTPAPRAPPKAPAHRAHTPIQRQLTEKHHLVQLFAEKLSLAAPQSQRHREIESRPFLAHIARLGMHPTQINLPRKT